MTHTIKSLTPQTSLPGIPCTGCRSCRGCPMELDIPAIFAMLNAYYASGDMTSLRGILDIPGDRQPKGCVGCGECLSHCPESIDIPGIMLKAAAQIRSLEASLPLTPSGTKTTESKQE